MKISRKITNILVISSIIFISTINSYADTAKDVSIDTTFNYNDGVWYPGRLEYKNFYITNNQKNDIKVDRMYLELKDCKDLNSNQVLDINNNKFKEVSKNSTVKLMYKDNILFEEKLDNILAKKGIALSKKVDIKSNQKELLNMTIYMDEDMKNDAQAIESIFNIGVSYKVDTNTGIYGSTDSEDNNENNQRTGSDKLPQTGSIVNATSLLALGTVIIASGLALNKKSKEEGGNHNE